MGVSTRKLVYDFKRKRGLNDSGSGVQLKLTEIIAYLNESYKTWYDRRVQVAQVDEKARNDLRIFKEDQVSLGLSKIDDNITLAKYPKDLYKRLNQIALVSKDCCPGFVKQIIPRLIESDDLYEARRNPLRRADFFFEQLLAIESQKGILIYHDGEFKVDKVIIDYYRSPKELHSPSLEVCDGPYYYDYNGVIITKDQDCEVGSDTFSDIEIVNLAVAISERDVKDLSQFESQMNLIAGTQNIFK